MARTAPVPNFPAIPGMNPGLFVLGGGGDGGGSGAGKGKGRAGKQRGRGKNGGKDARGGGKNAASCGAGAGGSCPNPQHGGTGTAAGDPVDVVSGRVYTVATIDLDLPGWLPLRLRRSYSTDAREHDVGLGWGWRHSFAWQIVEHRRTLRLFSPEASAIAAPRPEPLGSMRLPVGTLTRVANGYRLDSDGLVRWLTHAVEGGFLLSRVVDRNGNAIELVYEGARLDRILDSAGRVVRVRRHGDGHIAAFEVMCPSGQGLSPVSFRTYEYDEAGHLVRATDALGSSERFAYDDDHRLVRREEPGGLIAEHRYDAAGRCVETFCSRPGNEALDQDVPALLADGTTPAKGFLHVKLEYGDGVTEVITSRAVRRVEGNHKDQADKIVWAGGVHSQTFDAAGQVVSHTDAAGATWTLSRDQDGRLEAAVDPLGGRTEYEYDERGFFAKMRNAERREVRYAHDDRGNVLSLHDALGLVVSFVYGPHGEVIEAQLPNGGITRMTYDELGNRVQIVEPDGAVRRVAHDFLGRPVEYVDELGGVTRYAYDACGRHIRTLDPAGAVTCEEYDADGNVSAQIDGDGARTQLVWSASRVVSKVIRPDGAEVRYFYDRELELVRIVNEIGEEHRLVRSGEGRVVEERTFDGRVRRYRHDLLGQITAIDDATGKTTFAYDELGRLVEREDPDGVKERYAYNALGEVVEIDRGDVVHRFTYDARGRVAREETAYPGGGFATVTEHDALGHPVRVIGPAGTVEIRRDIRGRPIEATYGDSAPAVFRYDAAGQVVERLLPGGGRVTSSYTPVGLPARYDVLRPQGGAPAGVPDWVGGRPPDATLVRSLEWSAAQRIVGQDDLAGDRIAWERDARGRITRERRAGRPDEVLRYGPSGDLHSPAEPRTYDRGGRPASRGATTYTYDDAGRVIEKRRSEGAFERVWRFEWRGDGTLAAVRVQGGPPGPGAPPEDTEVRFTYDGFARRLEKRVARRGRLVSRVRYAWDGDAIVREVREAHDQGADPVVEERTYVHLPGSPLPMAQSVSKNGASGLFEHVLYTPPGLPDALVAGDGAVVATFDPALDGRPRAAADRLPHRFPGQIEDVETGLFYNRYRYHDPDTGAYLSPEPIGLEGSLKLYAYADHYPRDLIDLNGLARMDCRITRRPPLEPIDTRSRERQRTDLHPAVQAALPPGNARGGDSPVGPQSCAEPLALSEHLDDWERRNAPNTCRPEDPNWQRNLQSALGEIDPNGGIASSMNGVPRASCPNCSQTIPRLWALAGQMPPSNVIAPGYQGQRRRGPFGPTSPPATDFSRDPQNQMASTNDYGAQNLGTWSHQNGQWRRSRQR